MTKSLLDRKWPMFGGFTIENMVMSQSYGGLPEGIPDGTRVPEICCTNLGDVSYLLSDHWLNLYSYSSR